MKTPIVDFVRAYSDGGESRFHMPGHKGCGLIGVEKYDITEIEGADVLYSPTGIIAESEENATALFGSAHTFYSAEGSTLCIKAMLAIIAKCKKHDTPPLILAARNAHKAFLYAVGLLGCEVEWLWGESGHLCSAAVTARCVRDCIEKMERKPDAVYVTSPDYLGNILDIGGIARVLDEWDIPLLVDNAHGAYLHFLPESMHPLALGAAMCSDSAHKTLPVLTGGAYLHVGKKFEKYLPHARECLSLFASTSPSYLILQSLDLCNAYLDGDYRERLSALVRRIDELKREISSLGYSVLDGEPCKIVLKTSEFGYTGTHFAEKLRGFGIVSEFSDSEFCVLMVSAENDGDDLARLKSALTSISPLPPLEKKGLPPVRLATGMSVREALLSPCEVLSVDCALGRICGSPTVSCPPAIPIAMAGEIIDSSAVKLFKAYGVEEIYVVKTDGNESKKSLKRRML